jgi:hypothetical protein
MNSLLQAMPTTGMYYFLLDDTTVSTLTINNNKRVVCTLNGDVKLHSALIKNTAGNYYITISKKLCKQHKFGLGSSFDLKFEIDSNEFQFEFPPELQAVLSTDADAWAAFKTLTDGNKRSLMYLVAKIKTQQKRIDKALSIAQYIKQGVTNAKLIK